MELRGKRILVTGASSGIGHALARELAEQGAVVAVAGRNVRRLEELADEIAAAGSVRPVVLTADLSERGSADSLATRATAALGTVDVLINNAAVEGVGAYCTAGDDDESRELFETNYWSPMMLIRTLVRDMRSRRTGAIVNVSSLGAITPISGTGHYPSSKAALAVATETLRSELRGSGVHVVLVYPGFVDTPMLRAFEARADLPSRTRRSLSMMPVGKPDALARLVVKALRRGRGTVVYPRSYALTPLVPAVSRRVTNLLFGSAGSMGCRWTSLHRSRCCATGTPAV